ncbi:MAG: Membrane dipeptidase [uncultured Phycisphaerae bacterium]|uniref:Membrane dipeptidase n=1 Tax=uncultured Phycisphaerae bacterium TaxID=904963 RepID=A0A6J4NWR7_9BACT|nr:MAG: Membrane dipeptidase [uncultured Phycisphaerae bacterium]
MRLIFDAHLDLGWCAVSYNRDLTLSVDEVRRRERGMTDEPARGNNTLTLPELRRAGVGVAVATLLARGGPEQKFQPAYKRTDLDHATQSIAFAAAHAQLAYYRLLEQQGHLRVLRTRGELDAHWAAYRAAPGTTPLGVILSMEGADPIVEPAQVPYWWEQGLRAVGPAHYGRSHYAYGTGVDGPLSARGVELLKCFEQVGMVLDATHLSDASFWHAMEVYHGPVLASHHNCRALVPGDRQLADEQIRTLVGRGAVIGVALDAWMLYPPGWVRGVTKPDVVGLAAVADHVDHVCQLAGDTRHSAIGSDLDGGFGYEQTPRDLNTIADLQKLADILSGRGYADADVDAIFHGNWLRFFRDALPA